MGKISVVILFSFLFACSCFAEGMTTYERGLDVTLICDDHPVATCESGKSKKITFVVTIPPYIIKAYKIVHEFNPHSTEKFEGYSRIDIRKQIYGDCWIEGAGIKEKCTNDFLREEIKGKKK